MEAEFSCVFCIHDFLFDSKKYQNQETLEMNISDKSYQSKFEHY